MDLHDDGELFSLKWNNFQKNVSSQFEKLRDDEDLVDVTFACDGKMIGVHKLILFACSPYFKELLKNKGSHSIFYMNHVKFEILKAIVDYMYLGEVEIRNDNLQEFMKTAENLQIRGLTSEKDLFKAKEQNNHESIDGTKRPHQNHNSNRNSKRNKMNSHSNVLMNSLHDEHLTIDGGFESTSRDMDENSAHLPKSEIDEYVEDGEHYSIQNLTEGEATEVDGSALLSVSDYDQEPGTSQMNQKMEYDNWIDNTVNENQLQQAQNHIKSDELPEKKGKESRSCPVCGRIYSSTSNLRQHMRLIHNPTCVWCPICQKNFNSDLYLRRHMAAIHKTSQVKVY